MKKQLLFIFGLFISTLVLAQVPQGISHQAVMRDAENNLIVESLIGLRVSILQGAHDGEAIYVETHQEMTNQHGLITYVIGEGDVVYGTFTGIDWLAGPYWLETQADPTGGENYSITGITKFFSVPYSMYAEFAGYAETFTGLDALLARIEAIEEALDIEEPSNTVIDIDGNAYQTVMIGNQEWMAENLRVTRYNNEENIPTDLNNEDWGNTMEGAYTIYPHSFIDGLDSDAEVIAAYGKLYNWYAVNDSRGLCPEGWAVPSDTDWTQLVNFIVNQGFSNEWDNPNGAGNALKSCRQDGSPIDGCSTSEHPRWNSDDTHHGFDEFGFSALPGGSRSSDGDFYDVGYNGSWWSKTELRDNHAFLRDMFSNSGGLYQSNFNKENGFSVRCMREIVRTED